MSELELAFYNCNIKIHIELNLDMSMNHNIDFIQILRTVNAFPWRGGFISSVIHNCWIYQTYEIINWIARVLKTGVLASRSTASTATALHVPSVINTGSLHGIIATFLNIYSLISTALLSCASHSLRFSCKTNGRPSICCGAVQLLLLQGSVVRCRMRK